MARETLGYRDSILHDLMRPFVVKGSTKRLLVQVLKKFIKAEEAFDSELAELLTANFSQRAVYKPFCASFKKWVPSFIKECNDTHFASFLTEIYANAKEIRGQYTAELSVKPLKERLKARQKFSKSVKGDLNELVERLSKYNELAKEKA